MIAYEWLLILTLQTSSGVAIDHVTLHSRDSAACEAAGKAWVQQNDNRYAVRSIEYLCIKEHP